MDKIVILDFGSQYTQLIARRGREAGVYSEIHPCTIDLEDVRSMNPSGVILSGGPSSVYDEGAPQIDRKILEMKSDSGSHVPVLGICYGLQVMAHSGGGKVEKASRREFGRAELFIDDDSDLLKGMEQGGQIWMSHGDHLVKVPDGYSVIAHTDNAPIAAVKSNDTPCFGVQFHPEVVHSPQGHIVIENFVKGICGCKGDWNTESFIQSKTKEIQEQVGDDKVILGLSGGVDSSVAAILLHQAIGKQLTCIFINNGLLRKGEWEQVQDTFRKNFDLNLKAVDASDLFLERLAGISDPEEKRKIIGNTFIEVFENSQKEVVSEEGGKVKFLAQGTLYPDVIESVSFKGPSATIKSHHNVGGLPDDLDFELVEPFRELFKDEVREVGRALNVPSEIVDRHPFPGPGLGIRIMGPVSKPDLALLREADFIFLEELHKQGQYDKTWQAFAVLLPVQSVGVMGDERTYEKVCSLRAVTSLDGMTADWAHLPHEFLAYVSNRIINEVRGINRVVYDISSKPPATIEWE